jgi:hypothetical protein
LRLLDIVRQHRADVRSENLEDLTEAELLMKIAEFVLLSEGIVDDPDEQRFVAAALAIVPHSKVERILQLLDEICVSISPERVMEFQRDPIFLRSTAQMKAASTLGSCRLKHCSVCSRARLVGYKVCTHRRQSAPGNLPTATGDHINQPAESASNGPTRRRSGPPSKRTSVPLRPISAAHRQTNSPGEPEPTSRAARTSGMVGERDIGGHCPP